MKSNKPPIASLFAVLLAASLAGCGNSATEEIKNSKVGTEFTIGEDLDNKQGCEKVEWSSAKNADDRSVVTAVCSRPMPADLVAKMVSEETKEVVEYSARETKAIDETFEKARAYLGNAKAKLNEEALREAQQAVEALGPAVAELQEKYQAFQMAPPDPAASGNQAIALRQQRTNQAAAMRAELNPMKEQLKKAQDVIEQSKYYASIGRYYSSTQGDITPEDLQMYDQKKEAYSKLMKVKADERIANLEAFGKEIAAKKYGVSLSFVALKASAPRLTQADFFLGTPDNIKSLGFFSPQLLGSPKTFASTLKESARILTQSGIESIKAGTRNPNVMCFIGKEKFCDSK